MTTDHDKAECGEFSSHENVSGTGTDAEGWAAAVSAPVPAVCPLADFARRVRACGTHWRLEMLHSLMLRTVPVGQRAEYIALLNQRDEELSFKYTETV